MNADGRRGSALRLSEGLGTMPILDERTEAATSTHDSSDPGSPRPRRRMSLVGDRPTGGGRRGSHAPEMEAVALLRERFLHHLVTQVKLSNVTPLVLFSRRAGVHTVPERFHLAAALSCGLVICSALLFKVRERLPHWAQLPHDTAIVLMKKLDYACLSAMSLACLTEVVLAPGGALSASQGVLAYFSSAHLAVPTKWIVTQVPARMVLVPELLRNVACVALAAWHVHAVEAAALTPGFAAALLARGAATALAVPCVVNMCHHHLFKEEHLPVGMQLCPVPLRPALNATLRVCDKLKAKLAPEPLVGFLPLLGIHVSVAAAMYFLGSDSMLLASHMVLIAFCSLVLVQVVSRLHVSNATSLRMLEKRLGVASGFARVGLGAQLSGAVSEHDVLRVASEALHGLFPGATSQAVGTLSEGTLGVVSTLEVSALEEHERTALHNALPCALPLARAEDDDGVELPGALIVTDGPGSDSSVAFVCCQAPERGAVIADSTDWPEGVQAFSDWAAAAYAGGTSSGQFVTSRLVSGAATVGFVVLHFRTSRGFSAGTHAAPEMLREFCEAVGDAVVARRAKDAMEAAARLALEKEKRALSLSSIARDIYPQHLVAALEARLQRRESSAAASGRMLRAASSSQNIAAMAEVEVTDLLSDYYPAVTVLFADVVGYTSLAATLTAEQAMHLLDRLWQRFDTLTVAHGVYKVETIGDSYMCVSGMLPARPDHARAALRLALDLHAAAAGVDSGDGRSLQIRVGLHSGAVTSGVIGHLRARFCVFGDTVNTASRMESSGRAGCVQLSEAAYAACGLPPGAVPQRRLDVKGKGQMETYVLEAGSSEAAHVRALLDSTPLPAEPGTSVDGTVDGEELPGSLHGARGVSGASIGSGSNSGSAGAAARNSHVTSGAGAANEPETPGAPLQGPPSTIDSVHAFETQPSHAHGAALLKNDRAATHFVGQLAMSMAPNVAYICLAQHGPRVAALLRCVTALHVAMLALFVARLVRPAPRGAPLPRWCVLSVVWLHAAVMWALELTVLMDFTRAPGAECPDKRPFACARVFFRTMHAPLLLIPWATAQLPVSRVFFPELVRNVLYVGVACLMARSAGELSLSYLLAVATEGAACALLTPLLLVMCYRMPDGVLTVLADADTCPPALRGFRSSLVDAGLHLRRAWLGDQTLMDASSAMVIISYSTILVHRLFLASPPMSLPDAASALTQLLAVVLVSSCAAKLQPGGAREFDAAAQEAKNAEHARTLAALRDHLAGARSEAAILRAGCEALVELFPDALACAVGAFAEGSGCGVVSTLELLGDDDAQRALLDALPAHVGAATVPEDGPVSSVARTCQESLGRLALLDSRELAGGVHACADWAAALKAGLPTVHAVTAPLTAGHVVVGFVQTHFSAFSTQRSVQAAVLRELSDAVGGAIFVRRAFAVNRDAFAAGMRAAGVPSASVASDPRQAPATAGAPYPASDADAKALAELDERAAEDKATLSSWSLDAWDLEDAEVQRLFSAMLHAYGLLRRFRISPTAFASFIADVATHYNDNPFHNFRHAFMVTHTSWLFLADSSVRKRQLQEIDWLALLLAAVCHDLEHPGTTNSYQVNTGSALALRYNDASVLENHHSSVGWSLLDRAGLLKVLDLADIKALRKLVVAAILATDMSVHKDLLARVNARLSADAPPGAPPAVTISGAKPDAAVVASFSRDVPEDRQLLVSYLLHCADLCNPLFPPPMSRRIADQLSTEFARQAERERSEGLPITVMLAHDDVGKAKMETGFIDYVVRPLYATLASISPGLGARCLGLIDANRASWNELIHTDSETGSRRSNNGG